MSKGNTIDNRVDLDSKSDLKKKSLGDLGSY
jgi:hypothetical protein